MGLKQFKINFDNPEATYYGGQTVSGRLFVNVDSNKKIRGIHIRVRGEAEVRWTETRTLRDGEGKLRPINEYFRGHEVYFENCFYVLGGSGIETMLQAGDHCYPFSAVLPETLPSSFEGQLGHVRYTVWATLERPWKFNHDIKAAFSVVGPLDLNEMPKLQEPVQLTRGKYLGCWCFRSGPINLAVRIPTLGYVPGQDMPVTVEVDNNTRQPITRIALDLAKITTFHATLGTKTKTRVDNSEVLGRELGTVGANSKNSWTEKIRVPSLPPSYLRHCGILDVSYILTVKAELTGVQKELVAACDIVIGTVPLKSFWPTLTVIPLTPAPIGDVENGNVLPVDVHTETPSPYPELPPPTYEECILGPSNIRDPSEHEWMKGDLGFTPRYPSYNFDK